MTERYEQEGGPGNPGAPETEVFVSLKVVQQIIGQTPLFDQQKQRLLEDVANLQRKDLKTGVFFDPQNLLVIEGLVGIQNEGIIYRTVKDRIQDIVKTVELERDGHERFLSDVEEDLGLNDESQRKMTTRERRLFAYRKLGQLKDKAEQVEKLKKEAQKTDTEGEHIAAAIRIVLGPTGVKFQDLSPLEQRRITDDLKAHGIDTFDPDKI